MKTPATLALVIGNFTNEGMALYRTDGSGLYTSASEATGIDRWSLQSLTFSTFFFDYDLDGLLDILAVNGHVADDISVTQPHLKYAEPALVFRNQGKGMFENMSTKLGPALQRPIVGRGAAYGDFDNDGDLDLVITEANGPARLLRNENGNQNDMLRVKLIGHALQPRRHRRQAHTTGGYSSSAVTYGENRLGLFVAKRVAGNFRPGQADPGKKNAADHCMAQRPQGRRRTLSPISPSPCRKERELLPRVPSCFNTRKGSTPLTLSSPPAPPVPACRGACRGSEAEGSAVRAHALPMSAERIQPSPASQQSPLGARPA